MLGIVKDVLNTLAGGVKSDPVLALIGLIIIDVGVIAFFAFTGWFLFSILLGIIGVVVLLVVFYFIVRFKYGDFKTEDTQKENWGHPKYQNTIKLADSLSDKQKMEIRDTLNKAAKFTSDLTGIPMQYIRANIFGVDDNETMWMIENMNVNIDDIKEKTVSMPVGYGSSGKCFNNGKPNIAIMDEGWGDNRIEGKELEKIHKDLQWIISIPINRIVNGEVEPIWTLNIDCLSHKKEMGELEVLTKILTVWGEVIKQIANIN